MIDKKGASILPGMVLRFLDDRYPEILDYFYVKKDSDGLRIIDCHNNDSWRSSEELEIIGWFWDFPKVVSDEDLLLDFGIDRDTANYIRDGFERLSKFDFRAFIESEHEDES